MSILFAMALQAAAPAAAAAAAPTVAPAALPPNTCQPPDSCRYVHSFTLRRGSSVMEVKADAWVPLLSDGALQIFPGETLVIAVGKNGAPPSVLSAGQAADLPRNADDEKGEAAAIALDGGPAEHVNTTPLGSTALHPEADTIRVTFTQAAGKTDMVLRLDDGYRLGFSYQAQMRTEHGVDPTSVCPVQSGKISSESWPYPIIQLRLSQFTLEKVKAHVLADCK